MANEDIVAFDGTDFSLYFDGSDVELEGTIDAFAILSDNEILLSFTRAGSIPDISGTVDDSDIVKFTGTLGPQTSGSFELFFDGSEVGLTKSGEDIDGIDIQLAPDETVARLLLSTTGSFSVPGLSGADEDIFACNSPTPGPGTACGSLTLYFDGSDVGLSKSGEDVNALALSGGDVYLSTNGNFKTNGLSGGDEDVFVFTPSSTGSDTSGIYDPTLFFDGSDHGLGSNDLFAIDLP